MSRRPTRNPPLAPVFVINFGDGGRFTLDETEAVELHAQMTAWFDGLSDLKRRIATSLPDTDKPGEGEQP